MSCEYGFHCKQCDVSSETWINHGQEILSTYVLFWSTIRQMSMFSYDRLETSIVGHGYAMAEINDFLEQHEGHVIELADEHGRYEPLRSKDEIIGSRQITESILGQD